MSGSSEAELRDSLTPEFAAAGLEVLDVVRVGRRSPGVDVALVVFTAWAPSGSHAAHLEVRRGGGPSVVVWTSLFGVVGFGSRHSSGTPEIRALARAAREARGDSVVLSGEEARLIVALRDAIDARCTDGSLTSTVVEAGVSFPVAREVSGTVLDLTARRASVESVLRVAAAVADGAPLEWALRRYEEGS